MEQLTPYWPYIIVAIIGIIAGGLAGLLLGGGGLIRNLVVGVIGAFVGNFLVQAGLLSIPESLRQSLSIIPYGEEIAISTVGAILVVIIARILAR